MGEDRDKAFEPVDGVPALVAVGGEIATVAPALVVVGTAGQALPDLPEGWIRIDDPVEEGPLRGIHTGLQALASADVGLAYVGACDTITVTAAHVQFVLDTLQRAGGEALVPRQPDGTPSPLHAAVAVAPALAAATALLHAGKRSARALYERLDTRFVDADDLPRPDALLPANTPAQWARALEARRR